MSGFEKITGTMIHIHFFPSDDHSRVILMQLEGVPCSDYINASYIDVSDSQFKITDFFK